MKLKWTSVEDTLPPVGVPVLAYSETWGHMQQAAYEGTYAGSRHRFEDNNENPFFDVSHWAPLPDAPC